MSIDWQTLFVPQQSIAELVIRGTVIYLSLFLLLRVVVRHRLGALSVTDLLVIVLLADAAQNGMAGEYESITEGVVLCGTIIGWSILLDGLAYHVPLLRTWLEPPTKLLVQDGRINRRHMREEFITDDELMSQLREHGIEDLADVERAYVEPDGQISVIEKGKSEIREAPSRRKQNRR